MALIEFSDKGLYCRQGGFYLDPWTPVDKAIITHGHSDHARAGSKHYLCHTHSLPILKLRLGHHSYETLDWNAPIEINGVKVSLHPAAHVIGSSQIRLEYKGDTWVFSGDYKTEDDGLSGAFEPVKCNTFITESTFGLPIYKWKPQQEIYSDIQQWIVKNSDAGLTSILIAYSLGKAQRVLQAAAPVAKKIFVHGAIWNVHETLVNAGWNLPAVTRITPATSKEEMKGSVVIAPPSADGTPWIKRFSPYSVGNCSGWMQVRGNARRRNVDGGFVMSDHADWNGLVDTVKATGAEKVFVTHGYQAAFSRFLNENGIEAAEVKTQYGTDEPDTGTVANEEDDNGNQDAGKKLNDE
jgi:putative mRNA 3-end processing factor